jgi:hypothetical protein
MNIYETIEVLKTKLEEDQYFTSDLQVSYKIITDPYCDLSRLIPLILIKAEKTELLTSEFGVPFSQDHYLTISIFESAQKERYEVYKNNINTVAEKITNRLVSIDDTRIRRIIPFKIVHNETETDSVRCTGINLGVKVRTNWED